MTNSTVLSLVQSFCEEMGLPLPSALIGATDKSTRQLKALMFQVVRDLSEKRWQQQKVRKTFATLAGQDQGKLTTLFGEDYFGLVRDTGWNVTRRLRIYGPMPDQIWNALQTLPNAGPEYQAFIQQDHLLFSPDAVAGETVSFIVITRYTVLDSTGTTYKQFITADNDMLVFPDNVVLRSLYWRWRKQKGESGWEDDYNEAMGLVAGNMAKEGGERLSLSDQPNVGPWPGIIIPPGSWPV